MKSCAVCGEGIVQARSGRPRLYCSIRCKEATPLAQAAKKARAARYRDHPDRREIARKRTATWRAADPQRVRDLNHQNYQRYRDTRLESARAYREANREQTRQRAREYGKSHPEVVWRSDANRRARERNAFVETVDRTRIYERDRGKCGICGKAVKREEASVDHIVPLSKGGEHSYANTRLSHIRCNLVRGNRGAAQLRMMP